MATRKIFIDIDDRCHITPFIEEGMLNIHIKTVSDDITITFTKEDAKELIKEFFRIGKKL